jgi:hypothetical protein
VRGAIKPSVLSVCLRVIGRTEKRDLKRDEGAGVWRLGFGGTFIVGVVADVGVAGRPVDGLVVVGEGGRDGART